MPTDPKRVAGLRVTPKPTNGWASEHGVLFPTRFLLGYDGRWYRVHTKRAGGLAQMYIIRAGELVEVDNDSCTWVRGFAQT